MTSTPWAPDLDAFRPQRSGRAVGVMQRDAPVDLHPSDFADDPVPTVVTPESDRFAEPQPDRVQGSLRHLDPSVAQDPTLQFAHPAKPTSMV